MDFCAVRLTPRDACLERHVDPAFAQLGVVLEEASFGGVPGHMAKDPLRYSYSLTRSCLLEVVRVHALDLVRRLHRGAYVVVDHKPG